MKKVDLNVDIGEGFPYDEALLEFATSANICCGEHAGSWDLTQETVRMCKERGVRIGAHPGFPDRETFGRRLPSLEEVEAWSQNVIDQATRFNTSFSPAYVKPHGAWYNLEARRSCQIRGVPHEISVRTDVALFQVWDCCRLPFLMPPQSFGMKVCRIVAEGARRCTVELINEGFADRLYNEDGTLVHRSEPNAVLTDREEIANQALGLAPRFDSICLHGDTPNCLEFAELVYKTLVDNGYEVGH